MSLISNLYDTFLEWLNEWAYDRCKDRRLILDTESLQDEAREWVRDFYHAAEYVDFNECDFEEVQDLIENYYPEGFTGFCEAERKRLRQHDKDLKAAREKQANANAEI